MQIEVSSRLGKMDKHRLVTFSFTKSKCISASDVPRSLRPSCGGRILSNLPTLVERSVGGKTLNKPNYATHRNDVGPQSPPPLFNCLHRAVTFHLFGRPIFFCLQLTSGGQNLHLNGLIFAYLHLHIHIHTNICTNLHTFAHIFCG